MRENNPETRKRRRFTRLFRMHCAFMSSEKLHQELTKAPEKWFEYIDANHENKKEWPENPLEVIANKISDPEHVVADFGCGKNLLKRLIPNKVYPFDHVAYDETVIVCNFAHTPLEDKSVDVVVICLALWGDNIEGYFDEAYRVLTNEGTLYIAEPSKEYNQGQKEEMVKKLSEHGFDLCNMEDHGKFFYLTLTKKPTE